VEAGKERKTRKLMSMGGNLREKLTHKKDKNKGKGDQVNFFIFRSFFSFLLFLFYCNFIFVFILF